MVWAPLAVGATAIGRWTSARDPVNARLRAHLAALQRSGLEVERVLWQQGESDSRDGTDADVWLAALRTLRAGRAREGRARRVCRYNESNRMTGVRAL